MAVHFKGPGQATGEVDTLADLLPLLQRRLAFSPCGKKPSEAVGRSASVANKSKQTDAAVSALVAQVATRLRDRIRHLSDFGTRWTYSANIAQVPLWVRDAARMGYPPSDVRFQAFDVPGAGQQNNVLCGPGTGHAGFVLVCAHYDSLSETPSVKAPGADDNASGLAVLLEVAELLRTVPLRRGILFAAFGVRSRGCSARLLVPRSPPPRSWRIDVVLDLDMIAYQDPQRESREGRV